MPNPARVGVRAVSRASLSAGRPSAPGSSRARASARRPSAPETTGADRSRTAPHERRELAPQRLLVGRGRALGLDLGARRARRPAGRPGPRGRRSRPRCRSGARRPGTCGPSPPRPGWRSGWRSGPEANRSRALAMSTRGVRTGTPTASTWTASEPSRLRTMSRSWIIRSRTTSMSRLRGENGAQPVDLDEARPHRVRAQDVDGGVEALDVADLQDAAPLARPAAMRSSASARVERDRLLDQHVLARLEERRGPRGGGRRSGTATDDGVGLGEQVAQVREGPAAVARGDLARRGRGRCRRRRPARRPGAPA